MKIHILTASLKTNSGYANISRYLAKGLTKLGHNVTFTGLQTVHTPEYSYGFEILPIDTRYIVDKYQYLLNLQNTNADIAINIYQSDLPDMNEFAKSFKNTIFYTTIEGERIPTFSANDFVSILKQGGMVIFPSKFAKNEMEKIGIKNIPVIPYGYNDKIFKPLDMKDKDATTFCYYGTEVGKCMSDPLFLHKTGCYDCHHDCHNVDTTSNTTNTTSNTVRQCPYFKEEEICILKHSNNDKTWVPNNIPISKLKDQFKGKFVFLGIGHNNGVRKRWERMLKAYSIFISNNRQYKDRTHLHLHTVPMSIEGINLIEEIALLDKNSDTLPIENNVSFTYSTFGPSGFTEEAMSILYNCADVHVNSSSGEGFCVVPDSPILTLDRGVQKIKDIKIGDKVLTHKGRFKRVSQVMKREYSGDMIKIVSSKLRIPIILTPEHNVLAVKTEICTGSRKGAKDRPDLICKPGVKCYFTDNWKKYKLCKYISGYEPYRKYKTEWIDAGKLEIGDFVTYTRSTEKEVDIEKLRILNYIDDLNITGDSYEDNSIQTDIFGGFIEKTIKINTKGYTKEIPAEIELTKDFMRLCGYFIAEGNLREYMVRFAFHIEEQKYVKDVEKSMKDIFGLDRHDDPVYEAKSCNIRFQSKIVSQFFESLFAPKEYQKGKGHDRKTHIVRIPPEFMNLPKEKLAELLKGIWRGDGNKDVDRFSITTTSETLAHQILYIISKFNILATIRIDDTNKKLHDNWSLSYWIQMDGEDAELFGKIIDEECIRGAKNRISSQTIKGKNLFYVPIKDIEIIRYDDIVYNLEVEEDNSYVSSINVHNCMPVLESMACGKPQIATNFTSFPELIGEEITIEGQIQHIGPRGLLVKCEPQMTQTTSFKALIDQDDMANKMKIMYLNKTLRDNCSKNALKFVERYTWDKIMPMWDSLLKEIDYNNILSTVK